MKEKTTRIYIRLNIKTPNNFCMYTSAHRGLYQNCIEICFAIQITKLFWKTKKTSIDIDAQLNRPSRNNIILKTVCLTAKIENIT